MRSPGRGAYANHYDGHFAEHLAQVTESTLRSQWKKDLSVIHQ
jgi:hypothetical protein